MLMYTVSLSLRLLSYVNIHNQCSSTELISPVYFGNGAVCPKQSNQQIVIGTEMKTLFEIYTSQDEFEGALLYKLQRYAEPEDQNNIDTSITETDKSDTTYVHMLVA
jgi:hypothetical protein